MDLSSIDPQVLAAVTQSRAWIAFVSGALDDAADGHFGRRAVLRGRARRSQFAARASLWLGDRDGAAAGARADDAVGVTGRATDARRATIEAGLAALDGDPAAQDRSVPRRESWRELALPLQLVLCLLDAQRSAAATLRPGRERRALRRWVPTASAWLVTGGPRRPSVPHDRLDRVDPQRVLLPARVQPVVGDERRILQRRLADLEDLRHEP